MQQNVAPDLSLREGDFGTSSTGQDFHHEQDTGLLTFVSTLDISLADASSSLSRSLHVLGIHVTNEWQNLTHSFMTIFPNPYHNPPAPTSADKRTLFASALRAFRTRELNGAGMVKSA